MEHLSFYLDKLAKLRTDKSATRWTDATCYRAPHKPLLLLTVFNLIGQGVIKGNFIQLNADVLDVFDFYWVKSVGDTRDGNPTLPFFHLQSDNFWHLVPVPTQELVLKATSQIRSINQLHELVLGATLDDDLYQLALSDSSRELLCSVLIDNYFSSETQNHLRLAGLITSQSLTYARELTKKAHDQFTLKDVPAAEERYLTESRSIAFRRVVIQAYDYTCAMCRVRIITPEGRTATAAARCVPWSRSHNDDPRNGLALCGLHHWAFDHGLLSVDSNYTVKVSPIIGDEDPGTSQIRALRGNPILKPKDEHYIPAQDAITWHRSRIFRSKVGT